VQVPLTKLHDQDVMEGWLPLMPKAKMMTGSSGGGGGAAGGGGGGGGLDSSSLGPGGGASLLFGHRVTGSLRVRVQWVHSLPALVAYRLRLNREVKRNRDQVLATRRQSLRSLRDAARAMTRKRRAQRAQRRPSLTKGRGGSIDLSKHYLFMRGSGGGSGGGQSNRLDRTGSVDSVDFDRHDGGGGGGGWSGGDSGSDTTPSRNGGPYRTVRYGSGSGGSNSALGRASNKKAGNSGNGNDLGAVLGQVGAGMGYTGKSTSGDFRNTPTFDASGHTRRRSAAATFGASPDGLASDFPSALQAESAAAEAEKATAPLSDERRGFLKGVYRSFSRVMSAGGVLSVRPLQGLNLPHPRSHDQALYAKVIRVARVYEGCVCMWWVYWRLDM